MEFAERSELEVRTEIDELPLDDAGKLTVYRIVQEALTNIAKYASAATVWVSVGARSGWAHIAVRDDGVGFDPTAARVAAHGLAGMRFRVQSARGELKIKSRPDHGTTIQARLPLPDHVQEAVDSTMDIASLLGPGTFPKAPDVSQGVRQTE